jgi:hypothetical protein
MDEVHQKSSALLGKVRKFFKNIATVLLDDYTIIGLCNCKIGLKMRIKINDATNVSRIS